MKKWMAFICASLVAMYPGSTIPDTQAAGSQRPEFEIKEMFAKSGARLYGVKCRTETPQCKYDWRAFCTPGDARYSTLSGTESSAPNLIRAPDGLFVLLFLCPQGSIVVQP